MLSEISQRKTNTVCVHLYGESKYLNKTETHRYRDIYIQTHTNFLLWLPEGRGVERRAKW